MKPRKIKRRPVPTNCPYCQTNTMPDFKAVDTLMRYVSERGRLQAHTRTGICSKHQRFVARAIKYARHLALLPFSELT